PGLPPVVPRAAGALGMPCRRFLPAVAIGSGINIVVLVLVGFWAGGSVIGRLIQLGLSLRLVVTLALLAATAAALVVLRRRARLAHRALPSHGLPAGTVQRGLIAGFLAMFEMGIGINLVLYAMALVGLLEPQHALLRFLDLTARLAGSGQVALVALLVLFLAGGVVWALLYTAVAVRYLPGPPPVRGLLFSALPFAVSMGLLAALGFGPLGLGLGAGLIPCAGELTRCGLFGAGLGTAEQMVRDASGAA